MKISYFFYGQQTKQDTFVRYWLWSLFVLSRIVNKKVAKALSFLHIIKRSHVSIWNWIQKYRPKKISTKRKRILEFIVDETAIKVGSELIWLWVAIEPKNMEILALTISKERNMFVAEHFLSDIIQEYGKHSVSTDGGGTWYPQACRFLNLKHHIHSTREKSLVERTIQYIKDRIEIFNDYFPCRLKNCKMIHVLNWLNLFAYQHNEKKMA